MHTAQPFGGSLRLPQARLRAQGREVTALNSRGGGGGGKKLTEEGVDYYRNSRAVWNTPFLARAGVK